MQPKYIKEYEGEAVVAFVDLLGFSSEILNHWNRKTNNPKDRILEIQKNIQAKIRKDKTIQLLDNNDKFITKSAYGKILLVSDSFSIIFPLLKKDSDSRLASLINVCATILEIWDITIKLGFSIRAGIDVGPIYYNRSNVLGPAFIKAYYLESRIASSSRVVLSGNALKLISENLPHCKTALNQYFKTWFIVDIDGYVALDSTMVYGYGSSRKKNRNDGIKRIMKIQRNAPEPRLKEKYQGIISRLKTAVIPNSHPSIYDLYRDK